MENSEAQREENENPNPSPPWLELPDDVTANILQRLGAVEVLVTAQKVCTHWRRVCKLPSMWRMIDMRYPGNVRPLPGNLEIMCCYAVDRSEGQLVDINLERFGTDLLLWYIGERSKHLKCLKLTRCNQISTNRLAKVAESFPELEELKVSFIPDLTGNDIENIGTSCPNLKSFTYNTSEYSMYRVSNGSAFAIAKSMANLHHLELSGAGLDNEGLEAILDGCPHLESLHIRECYGVDLSGDLGKRCSQQIRSLRCPDDAVLGSTVYNDFDYYDDDDEYSDFDYYDDHFDVDSDFALRISD